MPTQEEIGGDAAPGLVVACGDAGNRIARDSGHPMILPIIDAPGRGISIGNRILDQSTLNQAFSTAAQLGRTASLPFGVAMAKALAGHDRVYITAGLGDPIGSLAAPVVAQVAKERHVLPVPIVTMPFHGEGARRGRMAALGAKRLAEISSPLVIPLDDHLDAVRHLPVSEALGNLDRLAGLALARLDDHVQTHGQGPIARQFSGTGQQRMQTATGRGPYRVEEALGMLRATLGAGADPSLIHLAGGNLAEADAHFLADHWVQEHGTPAPPIATVVRAALGDRVDLWWVQTNPGPD